MASERGQFQYAFGFGARADREAGVLYAGRAFRLGEAGLAQCLSGYARARVRGLLRIAMAVYVADRLSQRDWMSRIRGPYRHISVSIETSDPDFWRDEATIGLVRRIAEFLSDDTWEFDFAEPTPSSAPTRQGFLEFPKFLPEGPLVCLYSGGLDSAAGLASRLREWVGDVAVVTALHQAGQFRRVVEQLGILEARYGAHLYPIIAKTTLMRPPRMSLQELSQRSRSLVFCALGGLVADVTGASKVEMYENGVGAINIPPMTGMLVGGRMSKSSHPAFLRAMAELVSHVAERPITFVLPFATRTKGEMVRTLREDGLADLANVTVSCVHFPLRVKGSRKQCGVCPACIGRRQAMLAAGVEEPSGHYQYDFLGSREALEAIPYGELAHLEATLMQIEHLKEIRQAATVPQRIMRHLVGTGVVPPGEVCEPWVHLLARYRDEWLTLIAEAQARGLGWARLVPLSTKVA